MQEDALIYVIIHGLSGRSGLMQEDALSHVIIHGLSGRSGLSSGLEFHLETGL